MGGRCGSNAVRIQVMDCGKLVIKPVHVATLYNDYCVNITRCIGQPTVETIHMSDAKYIEIGVRKYHNHSRIIYK